MLETIGLGKTYGATLALVDFNIAVQPGEVIGVIGENGAGKSTFMKLLSGVITPTNGQIILDGKAQNFTKPLDAIQAGISMVHQELNLIPTLSVEDNLFLGKELGKTIVNRSQTRLRAVELLQRVGASFSPTTLCGDLSVAEQQLVEIAKAISEKARIVIFDEPTAVLSDI
ncbi:MAG: ATP-binding cassette domain-containing protein, partial [Armatimonadota bacterium]